jgi:hypothetical protein
VSALGQVRPPRAVDIAGGEAFLEVAGGDVFEDPLGRR